MRKRHYSNHQVRLGDGDPFVVSLGPFTLDLQELQNDSHTVTTAAGLVLAIFTFTLF